MSTPSLGRTANGLLALALTAHHKKYGLSMGFRSRKCRNITIKIGLFVTNNRKLSMYMAHKKHLSTQAKSSCRLERHQKLPIGFGELSNLPGDKSISVR
ncbi:MAG: hypothetical protein JXR43_03365 [Burkholderiaceae bacterium]|nr:hypothetical protein [Burkholderiaceae bacterium]